MREKALDAQTQGLEDPGCQVLADGQGVFGAVAQRAFDQRGATRDGLERAGAEEEVEAEELLADGVVVVGGALTDSIPEPSVKKCG